MSTDASTPEPRKFAGFRLTDTIALTALPVVAYLILFVYRIGYFGVFALPSQYIELSIGEVFVVIGGLTVSSISVLFIAGSLLSYLPPLNFPPGMRRRYRIYAPLFVVAFTPIVLGSSQLSTPYGLPLIGLLIALLAIDFVLPLITHRKISGYMNKLVANDTNLLGLDSDSMVRHLVSRVGQETIYVLIWAGVGLFVCYYLGRAAAINQVNYHIASTTPETVVLVTLKDKLVVAPFDRTLKLVEPSYQIIDPSQQKGLELRLEAIGPLHMNMPTPIPTATPEPTATPLLTSTLAPTITATIAPP